MKARIQNNYFTCDQINKIGNTIIYLSKKVPDLNKTKILNLLFILEEACIKKFCHPFFGIDFQIWKLGPIAKDIYIDLSDEIILLKDFIKKDTCYPHNFQSKAEFDDDEFSDNDIYLMDLIINFAKNKTTSYLIEYNRNQHSLWKKSAISYGVLEFLESGLMNSTDYYIDFSLLFNAPFVPMYLKERFESSKVHFEFLKPLKR